MLPVGSAFGQNPSGGSEERAIFQPEVSQHILPSTSEPLQSEREITGSKRSPEEIVPGEVLLPRVIMPSTRSSFLANWQNVSGATGYRIDVSISPLSIVT